MLYSSALYSAVIVAIVPGIVIGEQPEESSAVRVKINPFISKSKKIIQFRGDGRYKRNGPEKSALYLEFPESFFEDPKLKRLYNSLIGGRYSGDSKKPKPGKTDIVFQIDPSAFGEENERGEPKKRDIGGEELAAFQLKIAPPIPYAKKMRPGLHGFVPRHETTRAWCLDTTPETVWNSVPVTTDVCKESSTELVAETMCHPSKPSTPKLRICGGTTTEDFKSARPKDPCQCQSVSEDEPQQVETTPYDIYTQCKSREPVVTHFVETLCFTTERCSPKTTFMPYAIDIFSTTYKPIVKPSCPPSTQSATCTSPFYRIFRRRRNKRNQLKNFFLLSDVPQSCPPFCPPHCTTSCPLDCPKSTTSPTTCPTTCHTTCPTMLGQCTTTCSCTDTTTCSCPPTTCKGHKDLHTTCVTPNTCSITPTMDRCPKVKRARLDDPLRNVLRLFQRRNPRRVRRNPPSYRQGRRIWVYKPKHGLRKVNFHNRKSMLQA